MRWTRMLFIPAVAVFALGPVPSIPTLRGHGRLHDRRHERARRAPRDRRGRRHLRKGRRG